MKSKRVARWVGYGMLSLATLELASRLDDYARYDADPFKPYTINMLFRPGPFGREGVPSARFTKWQMNADGYRSPSWESGRVNVLTFGASETFGLYETPNHEFPRVLEARLNDRQPGGYNVVNIAMPGLRIGRVGYLEQALRRTQASHVVVYPSPANYIGVTQPFCGQPGGPVALPSGLSEWWRLPGKIDQLVKKTVPPQYLGPLRSASIWWEMRGRAPAAQVPQGTLEALREDLRCVVRATRQSGAVPVLVTHATYFGDAVRQQDQAMMLAWRRFYPELHESGFLDLERRANAVIRAVALESHVPLVDAAATIPRGPAYFADFVHFTDKGAEVMGSLLADAVIQEGAAPSPYRPEPMARANPRETRGK